MISIGGVIGTGLFVGSGAALKNGGPAGAFLGYAIIGSIVFSLCVSIGEMIAFLYVLALARFSQHTRLTPITLGQTWAVLLASPICMSTGRSDSL